MHIQCWTYPLLILNVIFTISPYLHQCPDLLHLHFSTKQHHLWTHHCSYVLPSVFTSSNFSMLSVQDHCDSDAMCMVTILLTGVQFLIVVLKWGKTGSHTNGQHTNNPFPPIVSLLPPPTSPYITIQKSSKKKSPRPPHGLMQTFTFPWQYTPNIDLWVPVHDNQHLLSTFALYCTKYSEEEYEACVQLCPGCICGWGDYQCVGQARSVLARNVDGACR